jgi:hypothetical protein
MHALIDLPAVAMQTLVVSAAMDIGQRGREIERARMLWLVMIYAQISANGLQQQHLRECGAVLLLDVTACAFDVIGPRT